MTATTGYQASPESNDSLISYGVEATWGTAPSVAFQAIRFNSETLQGSKARSRPAEVNPTGEASSNVTQSESAAGAINFSLSYGTHDELISVVMGNDWQAPVAVAGISGDIALANTDAVTCTLISTLDDKFIDVATPGQFIRLLGFTNAVNNGIYKVKTVVSTKSLVLTSYAETITETPTGTAAKVRGSMLRNGTAFKSLSVQKMLASNIFFRYPGLYVSGMTLGASVGQFFTGSFTCVAQSESSATVDQSTGDVLAAPTGDVIDSVNAQSMILVNDVKVDATPDTMSVNITRAGAAAEYGLFNSAAQGMIKGQLTATGSLVLFLKDLTEYARFKSEARVPVSLVTFDSAGNAYVITYRSAAIMNPGAVVSGPNQPIKANFTLEGNPASGGGTVQFDRLPAV